MKYYFVDRIESQAAEIGVLKIAHEAHQTNNLKMLVVLKKQAAEIASLQETLDDVTRVASDAENLVISQRDEIEKYKALCDQLAYAMEMHGAPFLHHELRYNEALEAWRAMK